MVDQVCDEGLHGLGFLDRPRLERPEAAEHRRRILEVAQELFAERGVEAVSMHQIAQAAGVGQGTLYRRYAHKGELCMDLMRDRWQCLWREIEAYRAQSDSRLSALERLDAALARMVSFVEESVRLLCTMCDASSGERRELQFHTPFYRWMHDFVAALLDEAVGRGELPPLDVVYTSDALLAALWPDLYLFQRHERGFTPEQILQGLRHIYVEGLHPPAPCRAANE